MKQPAIVVPGAAKLKADLALLRNPAPLRSCVKAG